jgi:hypothetical protein
MAQIGLGFQWLSDPPAFALVDPESTGNFVHG